MSITKNLLIFFIVGFFFFSVEAQNTKFTQFGLPFLQNYSPQDYQADYQNYAIAQDKRGIMYFGNELGVLVFNGVHWSIIHLPNQSQVKKLQIDQSGRVYVGGVDEFGYLKPNERGKLKYISLLEKIPDKHQNFGEVLQIFHTKKGIYYLTTRALFCFTNDKVKFIKSNSKLYLSGFQIKNKLFVQAADKGIMLLNAASRQLESLTAQRYFTKKCLAAILPYASDEYLFITQDAGFYIFREQQFIPWQQLDTSLLQNQQINYALQLADGHYAIASLQIGLVIINKAGKVIKHFDKNTGLPSNGVLTIFNDQNQNLWIGLSRGITHLAINEPYMLLDERLGLQGQINRLLFADNFLYIATSLNVFRSDFQKSQHFKRLPLTNGNIANLFLWKNKLLVSHPNNLLEIRDSITQPILPEVTTRALAVLPHDDNKLLALSEDKILLLQAKDDQLIIQKTLPGFDEKVKNLVVDDQGNIWLPHVTKGIYKAQINADSSGLKGVTLYTRAQGLPANVKNFVYKLDKEVIFATQKGIYRFANNKFIPHPDWEKTALNGQAIEVLAKDIKGKIWFATETKTGVLDVTKKSQVKYLPKIHKPSQILPLPNQTVAFIAQEGVVLYNPQQEKKSKTATFKVVIHKVEEDALGKDSVFFWGTFRNDKERIATQQSSRQVIHLPYKNNSIRFIFAAPFYENTLETTYQHILVNFDKNWSQWSKNTEKEYTNLPEGSYTFQVKARKIDGTESVVTSYRFVIRAPWYRTVWAYLVYIIGGGGLLFFLVRTNTQRHRNRREVLQQKIDKSTAKIQEQKEIIENSLKEETHKNNRLKSQEKVLRKHLDQLNATQKEVEQKNNMIETQKKKLEKILSEKIEQNSILHAQENTMRQNLEELVKAQSELTTVNETLQSQELEMRENMEKLIATQEQMAFTKAELDGQMSAIENSTIAKVEFNLNLQIVTANSAFCELFGYSLDEVKGKHHSVFVDKKYTTSEEYQAFLESLLGGACAPGEYQRITKDGDSIWLNATYSPVYNRKNKITKIIKLAVNITEAKALLKSTQEQAVVLQEKEGILREKMRELQSLKEVSDKNNQTISRQNKDIETALKEAKDKNEIMEAQEEEMRQNMEELLATQEEIEKTQLELNSQINAIENSPIVKAEFDLQGKIIAANNAFLELFYYDSDQIASGEVYHQMLLNPLYASSFEYEFFWGNLRNGSQQPGEYQRINQQEEELWLNATYFPAVNKRNQVFKIIMLAFDITASRRLLKDFQRQAEILRVQEEELRQNMEELVSTQEALQKESAKIESKNRLIMSSIQYAQNIQQAILPTKNKMGELFEDSFIVFIPKDIVSGDFYWTTQIKKRIKLRSKNPEEAALPGFQVFTFLAVVDCTGHGVPGAFMSMIGNSLLNEIVNNQNKHNPARILQLMHEGIRIRLMQEETSNRDGMDVCLCRLEYRDDDKIELTFSGAKRPIFLVRDGELKKIHGSIESIGGWLEGMERNYENKVIELEKDDALYLTSDGFADSANPRRKKFGEKRFRKLLTDIAHLPMDEQRATIVKALADHQQDTEQRDDITIVGVRV